MKFEEARNEFTDVRIPNAWQQVVATEKTAELLVYGVITQCMETFSDVAIELESSDPISVALKTWTLDEKVGFGTNAISITDSENGKVVLGCTYDVWKLIEDLDMMATDIFGTLNPERCGERVIDDNSIDIPDEKLNALMGGIQKKLVPNNTATSNGNQGK